MARRPTNDFEDRSLLGRLSASLRDLFRGSDDVQAAPIGMPDSPWRLSSIISFPFRLVAAFGIFLVSAWSSSRHWWPFVAGVPAMIMVLTAVAAATIPPWLLRLDKKRDVLYLGRYDHYVITPGQAPYALACALRSCDRNPGELFFKYRVGLAYQAAGDIDGTKRTMGSLASLDKPGFSRAHLWLADYQLSRASQPEGDIEAAKQVARQHLELALAVDSEAFTVEMAIADMRLAQLYFTEKRYDEAIPILLRLAENRLQFTVQLDAYPMLVEAVDSQGSPERTAAVLQKTLDILLPLARQAPDSVELWRAIILCCLRAKQFDQAQTFMEESLVLSRDPRVKFRLAVLKSELYVFRAEEFSDFNSESDYRGRLDAAARALLSNPLNRQAYLLLLPYLEAYLLEPERERMLREAMLDADTRPIVQLFVGYAEGLQGEIAEAERMWRIAAQSFPNAPFVVANLMFTSVEQNAFGADRIEKAVSIAERLFPDNLSFTIVRAEVEMLRNNFQLARQLLMPLLEGNVELLQLQMTYLKLLEHEGDADAIAAQQAKIQELRERIMQQL